MNHIANETSIHGIKEAWYANRIGRIFFGTIFITLGVAMFFQLKGLFQAYINESVGTRLTNPTAVDVVEAPSIYYCNNMWYPNLQGLKELNRGGHGVPRKMYEQMLALYGGVSRQNNTVHALDNHWRFMGMQDLINGIMLLPEKGRFDKIQIDALRPERDSYDFYYRAHHELNRMQEGIIDSSLRNTVENKLGESLMREYSTRTALVNRSHGIFPTEFQMGITLGDETTYRELFSRLSNRAGNLTLSLDGICWEFPTGPVREKTKQTMGKIHRHVVTHFGGLGRQFSDLMHLYLTTPGSTEMRNGEEISSTLGRLISDVLKYSTLYTNIYATHVSIATQGEPPLLFDQKIHIDSFAPRVLLKYWMKKSVLKSRSGSPCRSGTWTELDQAHCNQIYAEEKGKLLCEQYLPASNHFQETGITRQTCIYDHTGLFELAESAANKKCSKRCAGFPLQISPAGRQQVLLNLTANSVHCPRPCSETLFQFAATFPTSELHETLSQCVAGLAYFFLPPENVYEVWLGGFKVQFSGMSVNHVIFRMAFSMIKKRPFRHLFSRLYKHNEQYHHQWPCSVVEFERSEMHGQISEEYFLYTLPDLAANVGGTMGLWIGASVISIVQLIYLSCLKKLFKRVLRYKFKRLSKCFGRFGI